MLPPKWDDFPNSNDARCACGIWTLLAMAFIGYLSVATISFGESLQLPDQEDVYEVERQLPPVWIRLCELAALQAAINYSIFDHLVAKGRVNYVLPNGTEYRGEFRGGFQCVTARDLSAHTGLPLQTLQLEHADA